MLTNRMELVIVTGLSGAGRTQVLRTLEDFGYFCVDNLPPSMTIDLVNMVREDEDIDRVGIAIDGRSRDFFSNVYDTIATLRKMDLTLQILFLDASDEVLLRRFNQTRRLHPLSPDGRAMSGIQIERELMEPLKEQATTVIDTSGYSVKELRSVMAEKYALDKQEDGMLISVSTFGFKYGVPMDANMVFDVRFLPNPFYIEELKTKSGKDQSVSNYIFSFNQTKTFLDMLVEMIEYLLPYFQKEDKHQLSIAIGCTGGMHRSVAIAEALYQSLKQRGMRVYIEHRDIDKDVTRP